MYLQREAPIVLPRPGHVLCSVRSSRSTAWKSSGSSELNCRRSPVMGCVKPSVCACSAGLWSIPSSRFTATRLRISYRSGHSAEPGLQGCHLTSQGNSYC